MTERPRPPVHFKCERCGASVVDYLARTVEEAKGDHAERCKG